jgi:type IV secretory pathway VirB10-like protein
MRSAGNFHPEWGYLAPAPSFMRSVRTALVATAIGAIAGAVVVVSLVDHPGANDNNSSIAAHALVTTNAPVVTAPAVAALPFGKAAAAAPAQAPMPAKPQPAQQASAAPSVPKTASATSQSPTSMAALPDEAPPADAVPAIATDSPVANTAAARRHRFDSYQARRRWEAANNAKKQWHDNNNHGLAALFHLFGAPFAN